MRRAYRLRSINQYVQEVIFDWGCWQSTKAASASGSTCCNIHPLANANFHRGGRNTKDTVTVVERKMLWGLSLFLWLWIWSAHFIWNYIFRCSTFCGWRFVCVLINKNYFSIHSISFHSFWWAVHFINQEMMQVRKRRRPQCFRLAIHRLENTTRMRHTMKWILFWKLDAC